MCKEATLPRQTQPFDAKRAIAHLKRICDVSEFLSPATNPFDLGRREAKHYLGCGKLRLEVVKNSFEDLGYKVAIQPFQYRGSTAYNAIATNLGEFVPGTLLLTAHHDYRAALGAEDNASALAVLLELARCLGKYRQVAFASFDLEECGLVGSKYYVNHLPREEFKNISSVIAIECLGSGKNLVICTKVGATEYVDGITESEPKLVAQLHEAGRIAGNDLTCDKYVHFTSDHAPFSQRGIPSALLISLDADKPKLKVSEGKQEDRVLIAGGRMRDGRIAHSRFDTPKNIRIENLEQAGETLLSFIKHYWI